MCHTLVKNKPQLQICECQPDVFLEAEGMRKRQTLPNALDLAQPQFQD